MQELEQHSTSAHTLSAMIAQLATLALALQLPSSPIVRGAASSRRAPAVAMEIPQTIGEARQNFIAVSGKYNTLSMPTSAFVSMMLTQQFALVAPTYRYSRIYSVGFEALCTAFLPVTCTSPEAAEKTRKALYAGFDFDADGCKADAEAMLALAAGKTEEELFATDDFKQIKAAPFKYSLQFGHGLLALMKVVGVEPSEESIERWCLAIGMEGNAKSLTRDFSYFKEQMGKIEVFQEMLLQMDAQAKRNEATRLKAKAEKAAKEASEAEAEAAASPEPAA